MQTANIFDSKGLSKNRKFFLFIVLLLCFTPCLLNFLGLEFSSQSKSLVNAINDQAISPEYIHNISGELLHVFLEWSSIVVAVIAGLVAFIHYRIKHDVTVPLIGLALISVSFVDAFHILAATKLISANSANHDFIPFTWVLSRIFTAVAMLSVALLSVWFSKSILMKLSPEQRVKLLFSAAIFFAVLVVIIFWQINTSNFFPQTTFPKALITRPYDILPLAIFLCAGVFYWLWYNESASVLRYTLVLSMIPQVTTQFHMAYGSIALYDNHFNIAHFLKVISAGVILFGLIIDFIGEKKSINVNDSIDDIEPQLTKKPTIQHPYNKINLGKVKWPLAFKIPLVGFLFSLMISLIIAFIFYVESYQLVSEKEMSKLSLEAEIIKPLFSKFYGQSAQDISFLSATPPIQGMVFAKMAKDEALFSIWQQRLNSIFVELLKTKPHYKRISFITTAETNDVMVSALRKGNKVTGLTSSELPKDIPLTRLNELANTSYKKVFFSRMLLDHIKGEEIQNYTPYPSFYVATPIVNPTTNIVFGIVAIEVDLLSYVEELKEQSLKDIYFYITDEKGAFLYYPRQIQPQLKSMNIKQVFPQVHQYIQSEVDSAEIYEFEKRDKTLGLAFYAKVNFDFLAKVPPLYLLIENHNDEFLTAIQNMRFRVVLISLSLAFICLVMSIFAARKLIKPLSNMTRNLSDYEKRGTIGDLPVEEKDEIGLLARSFYHLFATIEHKSSELKQVATQAESTNLKLQAILNSIGDAVITINTEGEILAFNKSARSMFGYQESEVIHKNIKMLMPISFADNHDKYIKAHLMTGQSKIIGAGRELPAVRKNGEVFHMHLSINQVVTEEGIIYTGLVRDITETRKLEVEKKRILTEAKNAAWRLNFALSAPGIGVWDFDLATKQILWDERMFLLFDTDPLTEATPKQLWQKMIHPDDRKDIEKLIDKVVETDKEIQYQHRIILPNSEIRYIEAHAQVMLDEKGEKVSVVGTYRDNTEQHQLQILKQDALDMAEESLRLKSEFLASMSHEIRTPMNGVLGMLGLLEQSALSKQQAHQVRLAHSSAHSLLAIINDILDFSKIEAGKLELEILDFDIRNQFGELAESMAIRAQEKNLELVLDLIEINDSMVKGDPSRLRQILSNLVGNAIKFTNSGEVVIKAAVKKQDGQLILICSITDTGIGIPSDKLNQLFDSFTQVDATTTRKYGGTGLGLAIVKQLCDLMGGSVSLESEANKGCCVTFSINLADSERSKPVFPTTEVNEVNNIEILIVEDNQTNLNVLTNQLETWGANITKANDGLQALAIIEQAEENAFSIILIDMHIPHMDGVTLGKRIAENPKAKDSRLILMTPMNEEVESEYFANLGFSSYFPKPATTSDLLNTLSLVSTNQGSLNASKHSGCNSVKKDGLGLIASKLPKNGRILLVEDNRINQAVLLGVLANIHLHADVASNGIEAIDMLVKSKVNEDYQLIIMDCQMPELDGYETTRMIRKGDVGKRYQAIPIIAMTANAMKGDEDKCFAAGMSDYATKPVDAVILQQKLCHWLGEREQTLAEATNEVIDSPVISSDDDNIIEAIATSDDAKLSNVIWQKDDFLTRIRNNIQLANNLINLFIEDAPAIIEALIIAMKEGADDDIVHYAHKLKGSARNLGGSNLGEICEYIENNPREMVKEQVNSYIVSLESESKLLIQALQRFSQQ